MFKLKTMNLVSKLIIISQILTASYFAYAEDKQNQQQPDSYYLKQFQEVFEKAKYDYIKHPDRQKMTDAAINGMLESLDPYSGYYTDDDLEFFLTHTEGEFGGIGIEMIFDNGVIKVVTPIDDLPAYEAGIRAGDLIIGVNGKLVSTLGFTKAAKEMRGKPGTKLNLLVVKENSNTTKEIEMTRKIVKLKPVKADFEEDDAGAIAYLRISVFNNLTLSELKKSVEKIQNQLKAKNKNIDGIILDLRNNPGGTLDQAVAVGEYFIEQGVIVSIKGRDSKNATTLSAGRFVKKAPKVPLVVLINGGSASSAEIVAGALQDHKRGVVIGTTSFGKGIVQTFTQINDRAATKITTAKYYTPSGRSINAKGITPDIYIKNEKVDYIDPETNDKHFTSATVKSYLEKYNDEKTESDLEDKEKENNSAKLSEKYKEDYQYARAFDLVRGLIINLKKSE